ncbi:MAG: FAD-dependent oxidoreductase [Actinomycetota bacterium]|nr:FAD-dependent oxidoreductase [Actinomycetota bacterium]
MTAPPLRDRSVIWDSRPAHYTNFEELGMAVPAERRIVVVGGGLATAHACQQARRQGFEGELTVLSAERHPPYDRPPLSKAVLAGDIDDTALRFDTDAWPMDLRLGTTATGVDVDARRVLTAATTCPTTGW